MSIEDHYLYCSSDKEAKEDLENHLKEANVTVLGEKSSLNLKITKEDKDRLLREIGMISCGYNQDFMHIKDGINMYITRILKVKNQKTPKEFEIIEYECLAGGGCNRIYISHFPPEYFKSDSNHQE